MRFGYSKQANAREKGSSIPSSALRRFSGGALVLGGLLGFDSSTGVLGFLTLSLASSTESLAVGSALLLQSLGWLLLAAGLLALGVLLLQEMAGDDRLPRLLAALGTGWAAVSALASLAGLVVSTVVPGVSGLRSVMPVFVQGILLDTLAFLTYGGVAVAGVALGAALLHTRQLGRWWVLLPALGLLSVPQLLGPVLWVFTMPFAGSLSNPPGVLSLLPYALIAAGWVILGLLLVSKTGERGADIA